MSAVTMIMLGVLVVVSSAMASYFMGVSRERLWLRSRKSEELYHKAEETHLDLYNFFRQNYEISRSVVRQNDGRDIAAINRHIVDLKILVGIYFPSLGPQLAEAVSATATAFDMLRLLQTSDETNRERAFEALDYAVSNLKELVRPLQGGRAGGGTHRQDRPDIRRHAQPQPPRAIGKGLLHRVRMEEGLGIDAKSPASPGAELREPDAPRRQALFVVPPLSPEEHMDLIGAGRGRKSEISATGEFRRPCCKYALAQTKLVNAGKNGQYFRMLRLRHLNVGRRTRSYRNQPAELGDKSRLTGGAAPGPRRHGLCWGLCAM